MTDIDFIIAYMLERASQLDSSGRFAEANQIDRYAYKIVTAGFGGGMAEYVGKLLDLARSKGIDYMKARMEESRIVTLNDGTPIMKRDDPPQFIEAIVARAKALKLPETKGLQPKSPGKVDPRWSEESRKRTQDIASGKSSWLNQAKPFSDAMEEKKRKKLKWEPPKAKSEKPASENPAAKPTAATSKPAQSVAKPVSTPKSTSAPKKEVYYGSQDKLTPPKKEAPTAAAQQSAKSDVFNRLFGTPAKQAHEVGNPESNLPDFLKPKS